MFATLRRFCIIAIVVVLVTGAQIGSAQTPSPAEMAELQEFDEAQLEYQTGTVLLEGGFAALQLSPDLRYLDPAQTEIVLVDAWGNPPGAETLGMIFPANAGPLDDESWGVVISYDGGGYVSDKDAAEIDFAQLLQDMQAATKAESKDRIEQGYESLSLVGWATPPHYDPAQHKLYWAEDLVFGDESQGTLNYNIRVLGRHGVLVLNAVSGIAQLARVEQDMQSVLAAVAFEPGYRYADYNPGTDQLADYGVAALIAGGVAAKAGFFKVLVAMLIGAKKFLIIGIAALFALVRKLFGDRDESAIPNA